MDSIQKERASFALEVGREWHLIGAGVPQSLEGGESPAGLVAAEIGQLHLTSACTFCSAPRDGPWKVTASLEELCTG